MHIMDLWQADETRQQRPRDLYWNRDSMLSSYLPWLHLAREGVQRDTLRPRSLPQLKYFKVCLPSLFLRETILILDAVQLHEAYGKHCASLDISGASPRRLSLAPKNQLDLRDSHTPFYGTDHLSVSNHSEVLLH